MDPERTLLQQIRDKEQELAKKIEEVREETEALVGAARNESEDLICTAGTLAKTTAEQVYWKERGRTEIEAEELKRKAGLELEMRALQSEKNLSAATTQIVRYVTGE